MIEGGVIIGVIIDNGVTKTEVTAYKVSVVTPLFSNK